MRLDRRSGRLTDGESVFDPAGRQWHRTPDAAAGREAQPVSAVEAATWLQRESGTPCRVPVAVLGAREATATQMETAEAVGRRLAEIGLNVICGGREGVMEAACRGVAAAGGTAIGLLPEESWDFANPHVTVPIATGLGAARNAVIARAALCAVAIGGGYGTISEAAFCLQFGRPVVALSGGPPLDGVRHLPDAATAGEAVAGIVLALPAQRAG